VAGPEVGLFFVYPEELRHSHRVALFRDFITRKIEDLVNV